MTLAFLKWRQPLEYGDLSRFSFKEIERKTAQVKALQKLSRFDSYDQRQSATCG
jgi:hypothetical protein